MVDSYLVTETEEMAVRRQFEEQAEIRRRTGLGVRSRLDPDTYDATCMSQSLNHAEDLEPQEGVEPHPFFLHNQAMDGRDATLQIDTRYHPNAKVELENARHELQLRHNLKLGLARKFDPTPFQS